MNEYRSMIFYKSTYEVMCLLPTEQEKLEAFDGLVKYAFYDVEPEPSTNCVAMVYRQALPAIKQSKEKYLKKISG